MVVSYGIFFAVKAMAKCIKSARDALDTHDLCSTDYTVYSSPCRLGMSAAVPRTVTRHSFSC